MSNLAENWEVFTEQEIDRMSRAWKWMHPGSSLATLPFVSREVMTTALYLYTDIGRVGSNGWNNFSTKELNRKLKV